MFTTKHVSMARMMSKVGGPRYAVRLLRDRVVSSFLFYAVPVWRKALQVKFNDNKLSVVYRRTALRRCSAFRSVSDHAVFVMSGIMPIDVLADEITNIYNIKSISPLTKPKKAVKESSVNRWQEHWDARKRVGGQTGFSLPSRVAWSDCTVRLIILYSFSRGMEDITHVCGGLNS